LSHLHFLPPPDRSIGFLVMAPPTDHERTTNASFSIPYPPPLTPQTLPVCQVDTCYIRYFSRQCYRGELRPALPHPSASWFFCSFPPRCPPRRFLPDCSLIGPTIIARRTIKRVTSYPRVLSFLLTPRFGDLSRGPSL